MRECLHPPAVCAARVVTLLFFAITCVYAVPKSQQPFTVPNHLAKCIGGRFAVANITYEFVPVPTAVTDLCLQIRKDRDVDLQNVNSDISMNGTRLTRDAFANARDSPDTARVSAAVAILPFALSILGPSLLGLGRITNSWSLQYAGCVVNIATKLIAIPIGMLLFLAGIVIGNLEISLVGLSSFSFLGDWVGAGRLIILLLWTPNIAAMERWHVQKDGGRAVTYTLGAEDPFKGGREAFRRVIFLAGDESWKSKIPWTDQVIIALLAIKFVILSDDELNWKEDTHSPTIRELVHRLDRWEKAWDGQPGKWVREWTSFETYGESSEPYETTLRFVVLLYTCIRRGNFTEAYRRKQRSLLLKALTIPRNENMGWVFHMLRKSLNASALRRVYDVPVASTTSQPGSQVPSTVQVVGRVSSAGEAMPLAPGLTKLRRPH